MANDNEQEEKQGQGPVDLVMKAKQVIDKARREQAQNKVTELAKKKVEAEKAVRLIDAEIQQVVDDFNKGL